MLDISCWRNAQVMRRLLAKGQQVNDEFDAAIDCRYRRSQLRLSIGVFETLQGHRDSAL
jgi:hypothetical protein